MEDYYLDNANYTKINKYSLTQKYVNWKNMKYKKILSSIFKENDQNKSDVFRIVEYMNYKSYLLEGGAC